MTEKERKKLVEKLEKFIPVLKKAGKVAGLYALLNFCAPSSQAQTHSLSDKDPTLTTITYSTPTERVHYQVDTMARGEKRALGSHCVSQNTITINHSRTDKEFNKRSHSMETLIHEHQHQIAANKGALDWPVSLEQAYMLDIHDEIAANIAVLLYKRAEYIRTGNLDVFDGFFSYYKDQIITGNINPKSNTKEDFEKDMSVVADMTRIMWLGTYGVEDSYPKQHYRNACIYGDESGKYKNFWNENYLKSLKIIYNIGGVDFTQFMEKDEVNVIGGIEVLPLYKKELAKRQHIPSSELATVNKPINRSKISQEAMYPKWSPNKRVSPIQYAQVPVIKVDVPEGYFDQPVVEEIQQQENVVDNDNIAKKKKGKGKEGWNKFWGKVGDFFRPSWKQKPQDNSAPAKPAVSTPTPKPAPAQTSPSNIKPQNTAVDTAAQQPSQIVDSQSDKKTFKEKMHNFGEKLGDFFRPSWKQKPEKTTPETAVDTVNTVQVSAAAEAEQISTPSHAQPEQKVETTSDATSSAAATKTTEQKTSPSRISPTKSKIKINKLRTVKNKNKKAATEQSDHISPTKTQQKDLQRMQKEMEKYKQANSAHNN